VSVILERLDLYHICFKCNEESRSVGSHPESGLEE